MNITKMILGLSTATLVTGGIALPGFLGAAGAGDLSVTGTVAQHGDYYNSHDMIVPEAGRYTAVLTWPTASADLNLFVKNPAGRRIGEVLTKTGTVERYTFDAAARSTWKISVKARYGGSSYTLRLTPEGGGAPTEPPPTEPPPTEPPPTEPPPTEPPVPPSSGNFLKVAAFENENGSHKPSLVEAVDTARKFDLVVAQASTYTGLVPAMHAANPNVKVLVYMNAMFSQQSQGSAFPESWYMRDAAGNKVRSKGYGNYLMNGREQGWIDSRKQACRDLLTRGYDGCMLDMTGDAPLSKGYVSTGVPVNPATRSPWTSHEYLTMTAGVQSAVQTAVAPAWVIGNGLGSGTRYFAPEGPSSLLFGNNTGSIAESWLRSAGLPISTYRPETQWKQSVDMLVDAGRRGKVATVMVKIWSGASETQKNDYHRYTLGSFLLGTDGTAHYAATFEEGGLNQTKAQRWTDAEIGAPTGAYAKVGGAYSRTFTGGKVLVNPTKETVTVDLGGSYRDSEGAARTSVTLRPNTAEILARA